MINPHSKKFAEQLFLLKKPTETEGETRSRAQIQAQLKADTEAFLANGGRVNVLPPEQRAIH